MSFIAPIFIGIFIIIHRIILNYLISSGKNNIIYQNNIIIYGINENTVSLLNMTDTKLWNSNRIY